MKEITTEMALDAPAERIWELLSDFALYPEWNPLFTKAVGPTGAGDSFELMVELPGVGPFTVQPTMLVAERESRLCWQSSMFCQAVLGWKFSYELKPISNERLRFIQRSEFGGVLAPLFGFAMAKPVTDGMELLNQAVKRWGEKGNVSCLRC